LKKLKLLDQYRETLKEFGIIGSNIPSNNSHSANPFFKNKLVQKRDLKYDDLNNSFMLLGLKSRRSDSIDIPFSEEIE
jgi:hypothetical protein